MRKVTSVAMVLKVMIIVILSTSMCAFIASADIISLPVVNPSFEEATEGEYQNLTFNDSSPNDDQYYWIPGWSMYKQFSYAEKAAEVFVSNTAYDGVGTPTDGEKCLNLIDETSGYVNIWSDKIDVLPSTEYTLSFDAYSEAGVQYAGISFFTQSGQIIKQDTNVAANDTPALRITGHYIRWVVNGVTIPANTWRNLSGKVVSPPNAATARIAFSKLTTGTVSSSVDNVGLSYYVETISQPTFTPNTLVANGNVDIGITVTNFNQLPLPIMFIAGLHDNNNQMYNINAISNLGDITASGKLNLSLKMPADVSNKHIEVMVLNISGGRIRSYYEPVRLPMQAQ